MLTRIIEDLLIAKKFKKEYESIKSISLPIALKYTCIIGVSSFVSSLQFGGIGRALMISGGFSFCYFMVFAIYMSSGFCSTYNKKESLLFKQRKIPFFKEELYDKEKIKKIITIFDCLSGSSKAVVATKMNEIDSPNFIKHLIIDSYISESKNIEGFVLLIDYIGELKLLGKGIGGVEGKELRGIVKKN